MKDHINLIQQKKAEKRTEEYNKFLLKRFFKHLKKTKYEDTPLFLQKLYFDYFEKTFEKKEFMDFFNCSDIFENILSAKSIKKNQGNSLPQEDKQRLHPQNFKQFEF